MSQIEGKRCRCPMACIVPPHILDQLSKHANPKVKEYALESARFANQYRSRREMVVEAPGDVRVNTSVVRKVYSADGTHQTRKRLLRDETTGVSQDSSGNTVFDAFGKTHEFYKKVYQRNSLNGFGMELIGTVNLPINNAFFDGDEMLFGKGDGVVFSGFTNSLDVIAHELTHGVVNFNGSGGLEYWDQSGAINESVCDVFGSLVKQFTMSMPSDQASWAIGEEMMVDHPCLRSLANPHLGYGFTPTDYIPGQPKHMKEYDPTTFDNRGVHVNSGIPNHAFYKFAMFLGGNAWERPGEIWYETLTRGGLPNRGCTFGLFANTTVQFARGDAEANALKQAWYEVGIDVASSNAVSRSFSPNEKLQASLQQRLIKIRDDLNRVIQEL